VTPRLAFNGLLSNGKVATVFLGTGVDPRTEASALPQAGLLVNGQPLTVDRPHAALVGRELAEALGLQPGSTLMLQSRSQKGRENALDAQLQATVKGTTPLDSKRAVTISLSQAQALTGMKGRATEYVVGVADREAIDEVADAARAAIGPEYEVHTWRQLRPAIFTIIKAQRILLGVISLVFLLIAVFGVANTLLMSVMERTREIGTLLAVGFTRVQVGALFVLEAAAQALLGAGFGALVAMFAIDRVRARGGVEMPMGEGLDSFLIVPVVSVPVVAIAFGLTLVGAIVAALYPASRAARMRPVEALSSH
jgi:putative ABC transport system permease protein